MEEFNYECYRDGIVRIICPLFKKTVTFDFVYICHLHNIDQSAPNLGKIFMSNRIWMSSFMAPIGPEQLELFGLELWKIAAFDSLLSNIYKCKPISTKLGHNEYERKISDEFDYGSSHTRSVGVPLQRSGGVLLCFCRSVCRSVSRSVDL